jgi:hypothetical protein
MVRNRGAESVIEAIGTLSTGAILECSVRTECKRIVKYLYRARCRKLVSADTRVS